MNKLMEISAETARKILAAEILVGVLIIIAAVWLIRAQKNKVDHVITPTIDPADNIQLQ